ncbi:MAG: hypothetical protein WBC78_17815 [Candidatus Sulfotelmatobacter sp.]
MRPLAIFDRAGNFWRSPVLPLLLLLLMLAPFASAQRSASGSLAHAVAAGRPARSHFNGFASGRGAFSRSGFRRSSPYPYPYPYAPYASLPFPFFGDSFDPGDIYSTGYPVASEPPAYVLQAAQQMLGSASGSPRPDMISGNSRDSLSSQPLVMELQGGRYVRVASAAIDGEALPLNFGPNDGPNDNENDARELSPMRTQSNRLAGITTSPANELTPAVLVFRDGHSEEVRDYAIADGTLYVRGDYYTDGYWNKKIELSSLNLSQTLQANLDRHVKFILPSSPNEIVTRP